MNILPIFESSCHFEEPPWRREIPGILIAQDDRIRDFSPFGFEMTVNVSHFEEPAWRREIPETMIVQDDRIRDFSPFGFEMTK